MNLNAIKMVVELPRPTIQPVNRRIFCLSVRADEVKTKAGIIIPSSVSKTIEGQTERFVFNRYFVIAVAEDWDVTFRDGNTKEVRKPQRGDEVIIFYHEDALRYSPALVVDFDNGGQKYAVFHQEEIAGIVSIPPLVKEKDEKEEKKFTFLKCFRFSRKAKRTIHRSV